MLSPSASSEAPAVDATARPKPLGAFSLLALGINGIVGVGIFFAPSVVAQSVGGYGGCLVYLVMGVALMPIAWTVGTLGGRFGVDGGPYVWARAAFGSTFAFFVGWLTYVSAVFSTSAVVSGFAQYAAPLFSISGPTGTRLFALGAVVVLAAIASSGLKPSAWAWSAVTVLKLAPLVVLIGVGVIVGAPALAAPEPRALEPFERAALMVIFASQGFEIVPLVAGSAHRSERVVHRATMGSLVLAVLLYAALHAVCVSALPHLADSKTPLVDAARELGGTLAESIVSAGANVSAAGIAFGMIVMTPRYLAALGVPEALGTWIGREDVRLVPQRALWVTVGLVVALVALGDLRELFVLSSIAVLSQYAVCAAALWRLSNRGELGLARKHLWVVPASALTIGLCAAGAEVKELGSAAAIIGLGAVLLAANRRRV